MQLHIKFDPALFFFLPSQSLGGPKKEGVVYRLDRRASLKDIIESLGVPHTEVGEIRFNGKETGFEFIPDADGELIVRPPAEPFRVTEPSFLRPDPIDAIRFIADVNVIRLGRLMILAGFDVSYSPQYSDKEIADIARDEHRIVLTRDTALLKRKAIVFARRVRSNLPYEQLTEVVQFFGLKPTGAFFSRCSQCNCRLETVSKESVMHLLEPKTKQYYDLFFQCPQCCRVFWKGSHYDRIRSTFLSLGMLV